jgi:hypothetical protein
MSRSGARLLADLLDSTGDVKLENLDNTSAYTKPSAEPITYITGLQTALDGKIDDTQVLTNVPLNAVFTDTIGLAPDGDGSQLTGINAVVLGTTLPSPVSVIGSLFYNTGDNKFYISNGATWSLVANQGPVATGDTVNTIGTISTATYSLDLSLGSIHDLTLGTNVTITFTNPPASGTSSAITLIVRQPAASAGKTLTVSGAKYTDGVLPILSTGVNNLDVLAYWTIDGGSTYFGTFAMADVS